MSDIYSGGSDVFPGGSDAFSGGSDVYPGNVDVFGTSFQPTAPQAPGLNYSIPAVDNVTTFRVTTSDELMTQLNNFTVRNVVVAPGTYTRPTPIADMAAPTLTGVTGGTLTAGTYTYLVTAESAQGETMGAVQSITIDGTTQTAVKIDWTQHASGTVTRYRVYGRSGISSALRRLPTQPALGNTIITLTDTGASIVSATAPPTRNTTGYWVRVAAAHSIFCESPAGTFFNFGIMYANFKNWQLRGGKWLITDVLYAATDGTRSYAIGNFSGSTLAINSIVTDVTVKGPDPSVNTPVNHGVYIGQPDGVTVQRVDAQYFSHTGVVMLDDRSASTAVGNTLTDVNANQIYANPRGSLNGTFEVGVLVGNSVLNGVYRIRVRDTGIGGLQTINKVEDTDFADMDFDSCWGYEPVDPQNVHVGYVDSYGIYVERWTRRCSFRRFRIGGDIGDVNRGINNEWNYNRDFKLAQTYTPGTATMFLDTGNLVNMPTAGTVYIGNTTEIESTSMAVNYTGVQASPLALTGCSGGTGGPYAVGSWVSSMTGGYASSHSCIYKDGFIFCNMLRGAIAPAPLGAIRPGFGIQFDQGCTHPLVQNVVFKGHMSVGCITDHTGVPQATSTADTQLTQINNDFSGRSPGDPDIYYGATNI